MTTLALDPLMTAALCCLLAVAVWSDVSAHRIPNKLVLAVLCVGLIGQIAANGAMGFLYWIGGAAVGMAILLPFYIKRGMGAGDVKLMGAAGSMLGPIGALMATGLTLVAGFFLALAALSLRYFEFQFIAWRAARGVQGDVRIPSLLVEKDNASRIPYAAAIAAGCGIALWQLGHLSELITVAN